MTVSTTDAEAMTLPAQLDGGHPGRPSPRVPDLPPARRLQPRRVHVRQSRSQVRCCGEFGRCEIAKVAAYVGALEQAPAYRFRALGETIDHQIRRDLDLCVGCGRCVFACDTLEEAGAALQYGRDGRRSWVATAPDGGDGVATQGPTAADRSPTWAATWPCPRKTSLRASGCTFCGACVMVCPSGRADGRRCAGRRLAGEAAGARPRSEPPVLPPEDRVPFTADARGRGSRARGASSCCTTRRATSCRSSGVLDLRAGLAEALAGRLAGEAVFFTYEEEPHVHAARERDAGPATCRSTARCRGATTSSGDLFDDDEDRTRDGCRPASPVCSTRGGRSASAPRAPGWTRPPTTTGRWATRCASRALVDVAAEDSCTTCFAQPLADGPTGVIFTRAGAASQPGRRGSLRRRRTSRDRGSCDATGRPECGGIVWRCERAHEHRLRRRLSHRQPDAAPPARGARLPQRGGHRAHHPRSRRSVGGRPLGRRPHPGLRRRRVRPPPGRAAHPDAPHPRDAADRQGHGRLGGGGDRLPGRRAARCGRPSWRRSPPTITSPGASSSTTSARRRSRRKRSSSPPVWPRCSRSNSSWPRSTCRSS